MHIFLFSILGITLSDTLSKDSVFMTTIYNDSVSLYSKYKDDITFLKNLHPNDTAQWTASRSHKHTVTCAQQKQLSKYNGVEYVPIDSFKRPGFEGCAYSYPKPSEIQHVGIFIANTNGPKLRYVVYDEQTRFVVNENNKTISPYIQKITFDKGRIILIEKLNPVTKQKIP